MINILPPEIKEQVHYSRLNTVLIRYLFLVGIATVLLGATLWLIHLYANSQLTEYNQALNQRQQDLEEFNELKQQVEELDNRLDTIAQLYAQQTRFSLLLGDLAAALPRGAYINSIVLTGDAEQPVQLTITANSFPQAGIIKNALSTSERIESVDIQNISSSDEGSHSVNVVMAFSEDGAR